MAPYHPGLLQEIKLKGDDIEGITKLYGKLQLTLLLTSYYIISSLTYQNGLRFIFTVLFCYFGFFVGGVSPVCVNSSDHFFPVPRRLSHYHSNYKLIIEK